VTQHKNVSDDTAHAIDEEIRAFIDRNYQRAKDILTSHRDKLQLMAAALIKFETLNAEQIQDIMSGKVPRPPQDWDDTEPRSGNRKNSLKPKSDGAVGRPVQQH